MRKWPKYIALLLTSTFVGKELCAQWEIIDTGLPAITHISFPIENMGVVLGWKQTESGEYIRVLIRTDDYGESWVELQEFDQSVIQIHDIFMVNQEIGFMSITDYSDWSSTVLKSIDGGYTWENVSNDNLHFYHRICFANELLGYGTSPGDGWSFSIKAVTFDGGLNWSETGDETSGGRDIWLSEECQISLVKGSGIIESNDCGLNWEQNLINSEISRSYGSISKQGSTILTGGIGLVQGASTFNVGSLGTSADYGLTWQVLDFVNTSNIGDVHMFNQEEGIIVGTSEIWPNAIFKTWDQGETWHFQEYPQFNLSGQITGANKISCPSAEVCYLAGSSSLLRTLNGGGPSIGLADYTVSTVQLEKPKTTFEVFPNPATDVVNVTFSLPLPGAGRLAIINHTGRQVLSQTISAGATSAEVDVRALAAGVYLLRVMDGLSPLAVKTFVVE